MIDDLSKKSLASSIFERNSLHAAVSLDGCPIKLNETPFTNPKVKFTMMRYWLRYRPSQAKAYKTKPFVILCDMFSCSSVRVGGFKDLKTTPLQRDVLDWMIKWTSLNTSEIFEVARNHPEMLIPINLDVVKYNKHIREQLGERDRKDYPIFYEEGLAETRSNV